MLDKREHQCTSAKFVSNLKCALSVQTHLRHGYQHLLDDELRLSFCLHLLTLGYQLDGKGDEPRVDGKLSG